MKGPTIRRSPEGSARRTPNPPRSRGRASMTNAMGSTGLGSTGLGALMIFTPNVVSHSLARWFSDAEHAVGLIEPRGDGAAHAVRADPLDLEDQLVAQAGDGDRFSRHHRPIGVGRD